jgi:hypothetical protein
MIPFNITLQSDQVKSLEVSRLQKLKDTYDKEIAKLYVQYPLHRDSEFYDRMIEESRKYASKIKGELV